MQATRIQHQPHPLAPTTTNPQNAGIASFAFDQPSPDDIVHAAQRQRDHHHATTQSNSNSASERSHLVGDMQSLSVTGARTSATARKLPLSDYRPDEELRAACDDADTIESSPATKARLHLVVLGHVDAGKSTLMGRMLYELGHVEEKAVHKAKRDAAAAGKGSFAWAWMLDERPDERERGVTVDVATSRFETQHRMITLLDAPGHRDFVPNMIGGASQADAALLVVDGSPGGFEAGFSAGEVHGLGPGFSGGQTREHAQLARSLGIEQAVVVVTKLDTCQFSQERFDFIRSTLEPFLRGCGFRSGALRWLPAVGPTGENLVKPPQDPRLAAWYKGPTLAEAIDAFVPAHRQLERPLRMPLTEVTVKGSKGSVVVGGKLEGGAVRPGSKVLVLPGRLHATVTGVEIDGHAVPVARAGDSAELKLALSDGDASAVHRGAVVCHPDFPVPLAHSFEARVVVLDVPIPVVKGQAVTVHAHAARDSAHVSGLVSLIDGKSGDVIRERPRCLLKGQTAVIEVSPARPMPLESYADYRSLGRVALRDGGRTLAVGIVTAVR